MEKKTALNPALFTPSTRRAMAQRALAATFAAAGIDSAALDARVLLCAALGIDHAALVRDPDTALGPQVAALRDYAARRLRREPVSRILGRREFWGLALRVTPAVLDPRPDSEILVETVLRALGPRKADALAILDLGTGSGALLAALLHELPRSIGLGIDRAFDACLVARDNLRSLDLATRGRILQGSWFDALAARFDVIVSNPPYIARADLAGLDADVRGYDPVLALDGGRDGFEAYRAILPRVAGHLRADGLMAVEVGATQAETVAELARANGLAGVAITRDLAGHGRVVTAVPSAVTPLSSQP